MSDRAKRTQRPRRYVSRPTEIEAVQWTGNEDDVDAIVDFALDKVRRTDERLELLAGVDGVSGWLPVPVGHWIARNSGDNSDLWPLAPEVLDRKYKPANASFQAERARLRPDG